MVGLEGASRTLMMPHHLHLCMANQELVKDAVSANRSVVDSLRAGTTEEQYNRCLQLTSSLIDSTCKLMLVSGHSCGAHVRLCERHVSCRGHHGI
eukprot:4143322-Alexandrium_andersonii.AAC.1